MIQAEFLSLHGWLMKGKLPRFLPLLHTLVEERAGRGGFSPSHPALHEPAVLSLRFLL
jgi:hypothetical protein